MLGGGTTLVLRTEPTPERGWGTGPTPWLTGEMGNGDMENKPLGIPHNPTSAANGFHSFPAVTIPSTPAALALRDWELPTLGAINPGPEVVQVPVLEGAGRA